MEYLRKDDLEEIRKSPINGTDELSLYAVYKNLAHPVFKVQKLTKKYVYWNDGTNHSYPSSAAGYSLFSSKTEAWKKYKSLYETKKQHIQDQYERDMLALTRATTILDECAEKTPEYFL
ncbi:MAG: hypothetical protein DRH57_08210 [Candidatus Cloacimonadota bacterium]|nr:MAG: hypothetical protein DRH57_08210 [Candidatus Cloacimonadota bacterium]